MHNRNEPKQKQSIIYENKEITTIRSLHCALQTMKWTSSMIVSHIFNIFCSQIVSYIVSRIKQNDFFRLSLSLAFTLGFFLFFLSMAEIHVKDDD